MERNLLLTVFPPLLFCSLLAAPMVLAAAETETAVATKRVAKTQVEKLQQTVNQQQQTVSQQQQALDSHQKLLEEQSKALARQNQLIEELRKELDIIRGGENPVFADVPPKSEGEAKQGSPARPVPAAQAGTLAAANLEAGQEKERQTEDRVSAQQDDPSRNALKDFKNSFRIPGSTAAIRFGGFVKTTGIYNIDPLKSQDQFIVGTIPTSESVPRGVQAETNLTVNQSRMNFELREPTGKGDMRAFVEGDFAGDGDTFRLRHAFGQYGVLLAGKTWTAFADPESTPEEIDFEGLNARINIRQSQLRFTPSFGKERELQISLEDPESEIQNGNGLKKMPDLIGTLRLPSANLSHVKLSAIVREIRGQMQGGDGSVKSEIGYGISLSARHSIPFLGDGDNITGQLTYGHGIGRYINDLNTIGNYDGAFNTLTGDLELFDVTAGYISGQHWWNPKLRSNMTLGVVVVDELDFSSGSDYERTIRLSTNLLWSPIERIDLGGEALWGKREDVDGGNGDASQIQLTAKYRF